MPQILKALLISISDRDRFHISQKQTQAQPQYFPLALSTLMPSPSSSFPTSCHPVLYHDWIVSLSDSGGNVYSVASGKLMGLRLLS